MCRYIYVLNDGILKKKISNIIMNSLSRSWEFTSARYISFSHGEEIRELEKAGQVIVKGKVMKLP